MAENLWCNFDFVLLYKDLSLAFGPFFLADRCLSHTYLRNRLDTEKLQNAHVSIVKVTAMAIK